MKDITQSVHEGVQAASRLLDRLLAMLALPPHGLPRPEAGCDGGRALRISQPAAACMGAGVERSRRLRRPLSAAARRSRRTELDGRGHGTGAQTVLGALNWATQWYRPGSRLDVDPLVRSLFLLLLPRVAGRAANCFFHVPMEKK